MEGFRRMPSNRTLLSAMYLKVSAQMAWATSKVASMSCSPSSSTSGSTMGTRPLSCKSGNNWIRVITNTDNTHLAYSSVFNMGTRPLSC